MLDSRGGVNAVQTSTAQTAKASPRFYSCYFCFAPLQILIFVVITLPEYEVWGGAGMGGRVLGWSATVSGCEPGFPGLSQLQGDGAGVRKSQTETLIIPLMWSDITEQERTATTTLHEETVAWIGGLALPEMSVWDHF